MHLPSKTSNCLDLESCPSIALSRSKVLMSTWHLWKAQGNDAFKQMFVFTLQIHYAVSLQCMCRPPSGMLYISFFLVFGTQTGPGIKQHHFSLCCAIPLAFVLFCSILLSILQSNSVVLGLLTASLPSVLPVCSTVTRSKFGTKYPLWSIQLVCLFFVVFTDILLCSTKHSTSSFFYLSSQVLPVFSRATLHGDS